MFVVFDHSIKIFVFPNFNLNILQTCSMDLVQEFVLLSVCFSYMCCNISFFGCGADAIGVPKQAGRNIAMNSVAVRVVVASW